VAFANEKKEYKRKQQWKVLYYTVLHPKFASRWFSYLKSDDFAEIVAYRPKIYIKPFRVYMSTRWTQEQRVKVIRNSYRFILSKGELFKQVLYNKYTELARISLSESVTGLFILGYDNKYRKEGELVISFECKEMGGVIASAAFAFEEQQAGCWICRIGCVQGNRLLKNDVLKAMQKMWNGMRPKALIVFAVQEFARQLGFSALYGAGDSIQAYRKKHAIHIQRFHAISFDYDALWNEIGGQPNNEGWYKLPLTLVRKEKDEIKTHKRALYRRRYQQLDELSLKIADFVEKMH
jgi:uncharacterized protein VirK/YbjX